MPGFTDIIGQKRPVALLQTLLRKAILPHALLFSGMAGIGKQSAALAVALTLNCRNRDVDTEPPDGCGQCQSCRQILSGVHPDIIHILPKGNTLRIDQIRSLLHMLALKPHSARHRVVLLVDCHTMNREAANALLKVLEEPPANTTLILTASQRSGLLPTILSRCRHIAFQPLSETVLVNYLVDHRHMDPALARQSAAVAAGSRINAERMADSNWQRERQWMIRASGLQMPEGVPRRSASAALAFSAQLSRKKDRVHELLDILKAWIRDLIIWPYAPSLIMHTNDRDDLQGVRDHWDEVRLLSIWTAVEKAQKDIAAKANLRLTLDVMAIHMIKAMASSTNK